MKLSAKQILAFGGVAIAGFVVFVIVKIGRAAPGAVAAAAGEVGGFFNPLDQRNAINRGLNAIGDAIDDAEDNESFSIGSFIFDLFNPEFDPNAPITDQDGATRAAQNTSFRPQIPAPPPLKPARIVLVTTPII